MPEGPEVRRAADRIASAIEGHPIEAAFFAFDDLKPWEAGLSGQRVQRVRARGKALLIHFERGVTMYSHNQLYGRWFIRDRGVMPSTRRQLRAALHTAERSALLYSASEIAILHDDDLADHPYLRGLGPDPLDGDVRPSAVRDRLDDPRFRRRTLGHLFLDQRFLSGVGNYLRSEVLFDGRLEPSRRPIDLTSDERLALARSVVKTMRRAYRTRGVTNDPARVRRMQATGRPRRDYRHLVFARAGEECYRCHDIVARRLVAGRRLYLCPTCQT